jgi:hypothetical protein
VNCRRLDSICPLAPADVEGGREFVSMQTNGDPVCVYKCPCIYQGTTSHPPPSPPIHVSWRRITYEVECD